MMTLSRLSLMGVFVFLGFTGDSRAVEGDSFGNPKGQCGPRDRWRLSEILRQIFWPALSQSKKSDRPQPPTPLNH